MISKVKNIIESIPSRFRPEKALDLNIKVAFRLAGEYENTFTVAIENGQCYLNVDVSSDADCTVALSSTDYALLETGRANAHELFMAGSIKVSRPDVLLEFARCFRKFEDVSKFEKHYELKRNMFSGFLDGVRILDFTRLLPGPLATMFLAESGAEVIKVEDPQNPDYVRSFQPQQNGESVFYLALNNHKRSLAVNYLSEEGRNIIYRMVAECDVVIEQFRPGVMKQWGLDYDSLLRHNPNLIYASVTGYGQTGPMRNAAGHDMNYLALSGNLALNGFPEMPAIPGFQLADIAGGAYTLMYAVAAALFQREKTGNGTYLDVAMTDAIAPFSIMPFTEFCATQSPHKRSNWQLSGGMPNYSVYKCSDGKFLALGCLEPKFWSRFCNAVDKAEWIAIPYSNNQAEVNSLREELTTLIASKTQSEWTTLTTPIDACITPITEIHDLETSDYFVEKKLVANYTHPLYGAVKTMRNPMRTDFSEEKGWAAPALGEDTAALLNELGINDSELTFLKKQNVVKT